MTSHLAKMLQQGLQAMDLDLSAAQQQQLLDYLALLSKWNRAYNLSAIRDETQMVTRHLLDSLTLVPFIDGQRIIDVGTGPGLPGIPLAVVFPDKEFILLDSNGKKTRFVFQAKLALGLDSVTVVHDRVEHYRSPQQIDIVVSRAFASLADMADKTGHFAARLLAMKGVYPESELTDLPAGWKCGSVHSVQVPGDRADRHIIEVISQTGSEAQTAATGE